jgi:AbrB family looped-hinge helix DNA binding protein
MITTKLSSKGQLVLPRLVRIKLGLAPGARLLCEVRGNSVVLTPQGRTANRTGYGVNPVSGLRVARQSAGAEPVSSEMIRKLLEEFP